ncbi:MAG: hypothetical protein QOE70_4255 [Chthoniobacter sp.]|jgi:hypothetical protein|nr:hypothetical protein [Chthoniobacter sp.]
MKPVINLEETIGKTVGRRVVRDGFRYGMGMQKLAVELQRAFRHPRFPKGVFRFHSFEEADVWTMKYMTQRPPN